MRFISNQEQEPNIAVLCGVIASRSELLRRVVFRDVLRKTVDCLRTSSHVFLILELARARRKFLVRTFPSIHCNEFIYHLQRFSAGGPIRRPGGPTRQIIVLDDV
jgi:hypothetical protein